MLIEVLHVSSPSATYALTSRKSRIYAWHPWPLLASERPREKRFILIAACVPPATATVCENTGSFLGPGAPCSLVVESRACHFAFEPSRSARIPNETD